MGDVEEGLVLTVYVAETCTGEGTCGDVESWWGRLRGRAWRVRARIQEAWQ